MITLNRGWISEAREKPRFQILEIRDRVKPEGEQIAWLLIERQETYASVNSITDAAIRLHYEQILPKSAFRARGKGCFDGRYYKRDCESYIDAVSLTGGAVSLDLPGLEGHRIGTYLMNEIVTWAQRWPEATVNSIKLVRVQSQDDKIRRNKFYEQFNIKFHFLDAEQQEGYSLPILVKDLTTVKEWEKNIREFEVLEYLGDVLLVFEELEKRDRSIKSLSNELKRAKEKPLRWALQIILRRYGAMMLWGIAIVFFVALIWMRFRSG